MVKKRILIVDDDEGIRELFSHAFLKAGYEVRTAQSAEGALDILMDERYWVMFLDLNLPGMDGIKLCRQVHKDLPMAITYAVTAYASHFELSECRDAGFEDYFIKPVDLSDLLEAADHAFKKLERWERK